MPTRPPRPEVRLLLAAAATGGACSIVAVEGRAGVVVPPHVRGHHDLALTAVRGRAMVRCGDLASTIAAPGDVVWLPRGAPSRLEFLDDARLLCAVLPGGLEELVEIAGAPGPVDGDDVAVLLRLADVALLPSRWGAAPATAV